MNIEQALREIANKAPIATDSYDEGYCLYCGGGYPEFDSLDFIHDAECAWDYLRKQVEEDSRIERHLFQTYPEFMEMLMKQEGESK